jgi:helicase MOV-10
MVEAIRQVLSVDPQARVLACAPSNSAADLIASRLTALSTDELFRFYAPSRNKDQVSLELREYTHTTPNGHFSVHPLAKMMRFRVVVTTCVSASVVSGIGIARGHYTHIFIDEAGQATEPEAMIGAWSFYLLCALLTEPVQQSRPWRTTALISFCLAIPSSSGRSSARALRGT